MCFKYEDSYGNCFDYLWHDWLDDPSIEQALKYFDVKLVDSQQCCNEFFELLASWHERGLIKPSD